MTGEPHRHFHDELSALKNRLLHMSSQAEEALGRSVRALLDRDKEAAQTVIEQDTHIDSIELEIQETVTNLLALHQPVAKDLRLLLAALEISNDLERVGDHAVNIAESAQRITTDEIVTPEPELVEMARIARSMLSDALNAFVRGDSEAGRAVCARDDQVDALQESLFRILVGHMVEEPQAIGAAMQLFLVGRNLERVADLATNICEDVVFLVEGKTIKHHAEESQATEVS